MVVYDPGFGLILLGLMLMAILYSSIGHGGASGYLVVLSLTSFGLMEPVWLKQNVWCLNLVVSSIAFYHYRNSGFHDWGLTLPFVMSSVPMVLIGSYMRVDGVLYDILLSFVLLLAAWRLYATVEHDEGEIFETPGFRRDIIAFGGGIGLASGVIGFRWWNFPVSCHHPEMGFPQNDCGNRISVRLAKFRGWIGWFQFIRGFWC